MKRFVFKNICKRIEVSRTIGDAVVWQWEAYYMLQFSTACALFDGDNRQCRFVFSYWIHIGFFKIDLWEK